MLIQGNPLSALTPLILVHAISGLALPYLGLSSLGEDDRPVYGVTSPAYSDGDYRLPSSLRHVAQQYLGLIKRDVQPTGPYLLGGWSMGGVIALNMADILRQQNETVLHVIMIDSGCPGIYPPFHDRAEHETIAALLFATVTEGRAARPSALASEHSGSSSEDDEDFDPNQIFSRMQKHIHNGLAMIACAGESECLAHGYDGKVTLIKCSSLSQPSSVLSSARKEAVLRCFVDEQSGWNQHGRFCDFRTLRVHSQHDSAFHKEHVSNLSRIIRGILTDVE